MLYIKSKKSKEKMILWIKNSTKIFDVQNKKFITVTCTAYGYMELYKAQSSSGWDILDFLTD